ncbi:MAG: putative transport system permease protein [Blastocatellia bacterium]|nr:putative transport system permease protein [Blastocatellia bacterium]
MKLIEILRVAVGAIWAHKLRSALTLLGMIVGVTAFVVVVSLIQGFNKYIDEKIAGIGSKSFTIQRFNFEDFKNLDTIAAAQRRNKELTLEDYEFLKSRASLIDKIGAKARASRAEVKRETKIAQDVPVDGAMSVIGDIDNVEVSDGRYITDAENDAAMRVAFIGMDVSNALFPAGSVSAIGQEIYVAGLPYRVIGVAVAKGTVFGVPQDNFVTLPLKTYGNNFGGFTRNRLLYFEATSKTDEAFNDSVEEARFLLRSRRHLKQADKDNFGIITPDAITGFRDRLLGPTFIVAIAVPAIALLVGGIVIMNIMLVSVTERTKEIGIRKALGARQIDILKQFLTEAVTLAAIGGSIGVLMAWVIGRIITVLFLPTYLSIVAILVTIVVSGGIGIAAGVVPAWKAARLDPIEALRAD